MSPFNSIPYYLLKPLMPRRLQISLRRLRAARKRLEFEGKWPIDEEAGTKPDQWSGWPEGKQFALVLTHDVETSQGQGRCYALARLEEQMGFRSSFNFVPERYKVSYELRAYLVKRNFEVGLHGLSHGWQDFALRSIFRLRVGKINRYLKEWNAVGYRSPSMQHNLEWYHDLNIEYDASTFDTDPFEPKPSGVKTIFPFYVHHNGSCGYVELPYTLAQDFTLFVILREKNVDIWKRKLDWIAEHGGMALVSVHPDYMNFNQGKSDMEQYPARYYEDFLGYCETRYKNQYWHVLPKEMARYWAANCKHRNMSIGGTSLTQSG